MGMANVKVKERLKEEEWVVGDRENPAAERRARSDLLYSAHVVALSTHRPARSQRGRVRALSPEPEGREKASPPVSYREHGRKHFIMHRFRWREAALCPPHGDRACSCRAHA
jgi:hypothetical protein